MAFVIHREVFNCLFTWQKMSWQTRCYDA